MSTTNATQQGDWRDGMVTQASRAGAMLATRERARNPLIPDHFLDVSGAGFPTEITVLAVQMPRAGNVHEQAQYRNMVNHGWLHVPWDAISGNGGRDGKADVPAATRHDLGGGEAVATIAGHYLMFANRSQYENRRAQNLKRASQHLEYRLNEMEEKDEQGRKFARSDASGPMSLEELLEFEQRLGEEPARKGEVMG